MAVLLQMRGGQIQFLQGFHVLWRFQRLGWLGEASVLSGIFCTPPVSSVLGPVELDPAGDSGACQPRKGVELSGVALVGSFFNEKRAFFGGIDFIGGDNAGGFPDFYLWFLWHMFDFFIFDKAEGLKGIRRSICSAIILLSCLLNRNIIFWLLMDNITVIYARKQWFWAVKDHLVYSFGEYLICEYGIAKCIVALYTDNNIKMFSCIFIEFIKSSFALLPSLWYSGISKSPRQAACIFIYSGHSASWFPGNENYIRRKNGSKGW